MWLARTHSWQGCGWQGRTACPWQSHSCWKRGSRSWCRQLACSAQAYNLDPTLFCSLGNLRRRNCSWPLRCCNLWPCNAATSGGGTARHLVRLWRQENKKHEQPHARQSASATLPAFARPQHQQARVAKGKLTTPPSARILPGLNLQKQHLQPTSANKSNLPAWSSSKSSFASVSVLGAAPARGRSQQR